MTAEEPSLFTAEGAQIRLKKGLDQIDEQLGQFQYCNDFERLTGVRKSHAALGLGVLFFIMLVFNLAGQLLTHFISWVYPGKCVCVCVYGYKRAMGVSCVVMG